MITQADRAAEKRRVKLEDVQRQLKEGSLTIRKMTAEERKRFPPQPPTRGAPTTSAANSSASARRGGRGSLLEIRRQVLRSDLARRRPTSARL